MAIRLGDVAPDFTARPPKEQFTLRLARRQLGHPLLAPQGLHPGVHH